MKKDKIISIVLACFIFIILVLIIIFSTVSKPAKVIGKSMEPTLKEGQYITINKMHKTLQQGDIVIYKKQNDPTNKIVIKRVIATAGQVLEIKNQNIYVDGKLFNYINQAEIPKNYIKIVNLPDNHFFALGDNWSNSIDSRDYGPVSYNSIVGVMN